MTDAYARTGRLDAVVTIEEVSEQFARLNDELDHLFASLNATRSVVDDDAVMGAGSGVAGYLPYWVDDVEIGASGVYWDATNARLALGTTSPSALVHISGASSTPALIVGGVDSPAQNSVEVRATGGFVAFKDAANSIQYGVIGSGTGVLVSLQGLRLNATGANVIIMQESGNATVFGGAAAFGGTSSSFPALYRSSTHLRVRLADDSAYADLKVADLYANTNNAGNGFIMMGGIAADRNYGGIWVGQATPSFSNYTMLANAGTAQILFNTPGGGTTNDIEFRLGNTGRLHVGASGVSIHGVDNTAPTIPLTIRNSGKTATLQTVSNTGVVTFTAGITSNASADKAVIVNPTFTLTANSTSVASLQLPAPTVTLGGFTLTDATTLDIAGAPSAGTNLRAVWVRAGLSQFDGAVLGTSSILSNSGTAGIGYSTGAGGTVTQLTSKATGVTLNKVTGLITLNNAALAADAVVSFTLTNSAIAATDTVLLQHDSAGTAGAYMLNAQPAAGSATISVANRTTGSLSEAIVIRFTVIKSVSA